MLNFRKLKQDFSPTVLKEGKDLNGLKRVTSCKIIKLDNETIRIAGKVLGAFENTYESEFEIDRFESETIHSNCDCTYRYDCQHLAAMLFYLEEHIDSILIEYSKENDLEDSPIDNEEKEELIETIKIAKTKQEAKQDAQQQKLVLQEYAHAASILSDSPFFFCEKQNIVNKAELSLLFNPKSIEQGKKKIDVQLAMRLPYRSKPLQVPNIKEFIQSISFEEPVIMAEKKFFFTLDSFDDIGKKIMTQIINHANLDLGIKNDRAQRLAQLDSEIFGRLLAEVFEIAVKDSAKNNLGKLSEDLPCLPNIFIGTLETPLFYSYAPAGINFDLEYLDSPAAKLLLNPTLVLEQNRHSITDVFLFECTKPGLLHEGVYYRFADKIKRKHLQNLSSIREMTIPQPLFGTFVENALPELKHFAEVSFQDVIDNFVTLPYTKELQARCHLSYLDGELEASMYFTYDDIEVKFSNNNLSYDSVSSFVKDEGILARDLVEEKKVVDDLFQDFVFEPSQGLFITKSEKKIVEFMTEVIPRNKEKISFECPQNLLDQFIYDNTKFSLHFDVAKKVGYYSVELKVDGQLKGVKLDLLWDCVASKRSYIELHNQKRRNDNSSLFSKILVLDLDKINKIVQIFDEIGIQKLDSHQEQRPLWSIVNIDEALFDGLPIEFSMKEELKEIKKEILGEKEFKPSPVPTLIKADLRNYQKEGIHWLERLRSMYLSGVLADDMGLGKTLQAIVAISQAKLSHPQMPSLVVCPTSLLYNWKEEIQRFNPTLKVLLVDGVPQVRKKYLQTLTEHDVVITSYTLMQKDVDTYKNTTFVYTILDEAQHIKNRGTRNARSVKMLDSIYRLILTGTPIENSLEELWSLFDFLMPGFLSSFDRFVEKYIRVAGEEQQVNIQFLKRKVSPFILRRMKVDVLKDLPAVSEITYHSQLTDTQMQLYKSYAESAKDELVKLVERDGFEKVQIHVLATLTRLKQICCHPAIFAKDSVEANDSAKYELLFELLQALIEGGHKTVIFSQYTKMLQIMQEDLKQRGIRFAYLDGASKNRLQIVKDFNENNEIPVFLVSLKAGGTGLNITGADTVIHYDMWWNPAVENQATDRVHRIGQKKAVTSYKLVTVGTIEEKIVEMQRRKKGLVKKVISCDDEALTKLTWEDVLELLNT